MVNLSLSFVLSRALRSTGLVTGRDEKDRPRTLHNAAACYTAGRIIDDRTVVNCLASSPGSTL